MGDLTHLPANVGAPLLQRVRYVATDGDDGTATLGDINHPYKSVRTAVDACVEGDTVMLLPGAHNGDAPLILKKDVHLTSLVGRTSTSLSFSGRFPLQNASRVGPAGMGGQIQPAPGTSVFDSCQVSRLKIVMQTWDNANGTYTSPFGVSTATGNALTGTGASFIDFHVVDCEVLGFSDVVWIVDAVSRMYFRHCLISTWYDFCHILGPANTAHCTFEECTILYRPSYDMVNFITGTTVDTISRVRSGSLTLTNVKILTHNDGTAWSTTGVGDAHPAGIVVDHVSGAKLFINNVTWEVVTAFTQFPLRKYGSNAAAGTPSLGSVVVTGGAVDLCEYNSASTGGHVSPPRIVPRNPIVLKATVFAAAALSITQNNTYRCSAAATSQSFVMFTLPPGVAVKAAWLDRTTLFSGGSASAVTAEIGIVGSTAKYLAATDVKTTSGIATSANLQFVESSGDPFTGTGTLVEVTLRTTGANVSTLTAGQVDVYVELSAAAGV